MKVFVLYMDQDNSCGDPDCCGGPHPCPTIKIFSSKQAAEAAGLLEDELERLNEVEVDKNDYQYIDM